MTLRQRIRFYQQLAVLIRAGLPIRASLVRLKERIPGSEVAVLSEKVNAGERLGEAFAAARFSPFEGHLVAAGERSAQLDTIFEHLAEHWQRELHMRQDIIRPLIYPIVIMHLAVLLSSGIDLLTLPPSIAVAHLILNFALLYFAGFVSYTLVRVSWSSPLMRGFWLRVPIVGGALASTYAYRWISALRLEFTAGITLSQAVPDAWRASGYLGSAELAAESEAAIRAGSNLSSLMTRWRQLPRDWFDFIETAEISGKFDEAFKNIEAEAARTWRLAQERMAEWVPKIFYFVVLLVIAVQIIHIGKKIYVDPIVNAEKQIDNAVNNR